MKDNQNQSSPGIFSVLMSVLAAMIGVQSDKNRERDFKKGRASHYIIIGIVMTILFVFTLISIVNNIIEQSAK